MKRNTRIKSNMFLLLSSAISTSQSSSLKTGNKAVQGCKLISRIILGDKAATLLEKWHQTQSCLLRNHRKHQYINELDIKRHQTRHKQSNSTY